MTARTLAQHLGFADPELGSPGQHRLVTWLTEPDRLLKVLRCTWPEVLARKRAGTRAVLAAGRPSASPAESGIADVWERVIRIDLEKPFLRGGIYVVGFVDLVATVGWGLDGAPVVQATFYVEVKSQIRSVGSLLRQINLYRVYVREGHWVVVCNADKYRDLLRVSNDNYKTLLGILTSRWSKSREWRAMMWCLGLLFFHQPAYCPGQIHRCCCSQVL